MSCACAVGTGGTGRVLQAMESNDERRGDRCEKE